MCFYNEVKCLAPLLYSVACDDQPAVHSGKRGYARVTVQMCQVHPFGVPLLPPHFQHQF